jgi:O-methyltransferase / aklanonic acid methyltransferase
MGFSVGSYGTDVLDCVSMDSALQRAFGGAAYTYNTVGPCLFTHYAAKLVEFAGVGTAGDVLDVATGTGAVLMEAARLPGRGRLVGVDVTKAMLARAADEVELRGLAGVELRVMDAQALGFPDATFDVVFCAFAYSSFPSKPKAIHEFARVLRPSGRASIVDAFGWYFDQDPRWAWHRHLLEEFSVEVATDASGPRGLSDLLTSNGLTEVAVKDESYKLTFADEEEWWRWSWSHGTRLLLGAIPKPRREDFRSAAFTELRDLRSQEGAITAAMHATLMRADKPR